MNNNNNQSNQNTKITFQPAEVLITNYSLLLAKEVLDNWLIEEKPEVKSTDIVASMGLNNSKFVSKFAEDLKTNIVDSRYGVASFEELEIVDQEIKQYFKHTSDRIQDKFQKSRIHTIGATHKLFSGIFSVEFFTDLAKSLTKCGEDFEEKLHHILRKKESAWNAYCNLLNQIQQDEDNSLEFLVNNKCITNALSIYYGAKLEAINYQASRQLSLSLIELCRIYSDYTNRTKTMLLNIQRSIEQKIPEDSGSLPLFSDQKRINADHEKLLIELWIGHSVQHWGKAPVSWQQIEAKLLKNIEPIALGIYKDSQHHYKQNVSLNLSKEVVNQN